MAKVLVACAIAWPALMATATAARIHGTTPALSTVMYLIGGQVCHQKPERSFSTAGVHWPVCGRCSGLYLAAPLGAIVAWIASRRRVTRPSVVWLAIAAVPTAATFVAEKTGLAEVGNVLRFASALPLGFALAWVIVRTASLRVRLQ